jgi:hypothetical protein
MFRSLFQDHLQGSPFALSAPTTLQLHASSFVFVGMWSYALYLCVCVRCSCRCVLSGHALHDQTAHRQAVYAVSGTSRCLFSDKYKTHKYSVGRAYSC